MDSVREQSRRSSCSVTCTLATCYVVFGRVVQNQQSIPELFLINVTTVGCKLNKYPRLAVRGFKQDTLTDQKHRYHGIIKLALFED
jgi:hypothetical protein